jgi:hypothetical protein
MNFVSGAALVLIGTREPPSRVTRTERVDEMRSTGLKDTLAVEFAGFLRLHPAPAQEL